MLHPLREFITAGTLRDLRIGMTREEAQTAWGRGPDAAFTLGGPRFDSDWWRWNEGVDVRFSAVDERLWSITLRTPAFATWSTHFSDWRLDQPPSAASLLTHLEAARLPYQIGPGIQATVDVRVSKAYAEGGREVPPLWHHQVTIAGEPLTHFDSLIGGDPFQPNTAHAFAITYLHYEVPDEWRRIRNAIHGFGGKPESH